MLLLSPFHIRSIKYLFHSPVSLQLICSFMATFTAFPLQTRSSCSWDSFRSMGNEISKTQTAYIYTADRDRWPYFDDTAASDWWKRKPPIVRDQVLSVVARSCLADKSQTLPSSWPWHLSMPFNVSRSLNCKMYANAPSVGTIKRLLSKFLYNTLWWMLGPAVAEPWETACSVARYENCIMRSYGSNLTFNKLCISGIWSWAEVASYSQRVNGQFSVYVQSVQRQF